MKIKTNSSVPCTDGRRRLCKVPSTTEAPSAVQRSNLPVRGRGNMAKEQDKHKVWIIGVKRKAGKKKKKSADGGSWVKDKEEL